VGGREDLARGVIRAIGRPARRLAEDYLRMLRAVRFAATLEFRLDEATLDALRAAADRIRSVSAERVQAELTRLLLESPRAGAGLRLLRATGLLARLLPDVDALAGVEQPPQFHPEGDVFTHTAMMLDAMARPTLTLAYAVLLHDVGKGPTARVTVEPDGSRRIRFNRHAEVGAAMSDEILSGLKLPVRHREAVVHCVRNHMRFMDAPRMRKPTLRRLLAARTFPVELELHRLDCLCSHGNLSTYAFLRAAYEELQEQPALPEPWIGGHDLLALGLRPGPEVGRWLRAAYEAQLEERFADREALLAWLKASLSEVDPPGSG
jgi:poly(A) polymerase